MSLYRRKDSPFWWVKLPPIRGESKPLQQALLNFEWVKPLCVALPRCLALAERCCG